MKDTTKKITTGGPVTEQFPQAPIPPSASAYHMAVADSGGKSIALVRYIFADKGEVGEMFTDYLQQKISEA